MSDTQEIKSVTGDIKIAHTRATLNVNARNALIVYAVLTVGVTRADISRETGVDKSDVTRIVKLAESMPEVLASIQSMSRDGNVNARIDAAAEVGVNLKRDKSKSQTGIDTPKTLASGDSAEVALSDPADKVDVIALVSEYLTASKDRATLTNRASVLRDSINRVYRERSDVLTAEVNATKQAEKDAA